METKKAIEFLESEIYYWKPTISTLNNRIVDLGNKQAVKIYKDIIVLLKRGEKHEAIVKKLEARFINREAELFLIIKKTRRYKKMWEELENKDITYKSDSPVINDEMYYIKRKYFPKKEK